jgi:hypothetical protein
MKTQDTALNTELPSKEQEALAQLVQKEETKGAAGTTCIHTNGQPNALQLEESRHDYPLILWHDLTDHQKDDLRLLRQQLTRYEDALRDVRDPQIRSNIDRNYRQIKKCAQALEAKRTKELEQKTKEYKKLDSDQREERLRVYYRDFLKEHEIYYVASSHIYMEYFPDDGKWEEMRTEALHKHYGIRDQQELAAFDDVLEELGRKKVSIECSFFQKNPRVLNLMRRDHWLKPRPGKGATRRPRPLRGEWRAEIRVVGGIS